MEKSTSTYMPGLSRLGKNISDVHHYFLETYKEKRKEIVDGLSFFKDDLSERTGRYIDHVTLPINNFLKDVAQIEKEFKEEISKGEEYCICIDGKMIPASEVLSLSMEENY